MGYRVRRMLWALSGREMVSGQQRIFVHVITAHCLPAKRVQDELGRPQTHCCGPPPTLHLHRALTSTAGQSVHTFL